MIGWMKKYFHVLLLCVVVFSIVMVVLVSMPLNKNDIDSEKNAVFPQQWECSIDGGPFAPVVLPLNEDNSASRDITLKNQLSSETVKGATVFLRTSQQNVTIFLDDYEIYSSKGKFRETNIPASAYHFVRLPADYANKEITVVLSSPYDRYAGLASEIYIGSKASHLFFLMGEHGLRFVVGFLIFSIGVLVGIIFLFAKGGKNKASIIYLGSFLACAGFWLLVESTMAQIFIPYPATLTNVSIITLTLLPVFSGLYYLSAHAGILRRTGKYIVGFFIVGSIALSVGACFNPAIPLIVLPLYLLFMIFYVAVMLIALLVESVKTKRIFSVSTIGVLLFGALCLLELLLYLIDTKSYNNSNFLMLGLILLCSLMAADAIASFARVYQSAIKVDSLTTIAYTDVLTGLRNRTAFLERIEELTACDDGKVTLAMYDIDDLKIVNDSRGHVVGDSLIRRCVKVMKLSLRQADELYRIGGDEFVAIIEHETPIDLRRLEKRMSDFVEKENQKSLSYRLDIAYGYATYSKDIDETLLETLTRADAKMYACKKAQKEAANLA